MAMPGEFLLHHDGKRCQGLGPYCLEQVVSAGEVAVGGVGNHAGAAGGLAQHNGVGAAVTCQRDAGIEQGASQVAVMIGAAGRHAA